MNISPVDGATTLAPSSLDGSSPEQAASTRQIAAALRLIDGSSTLPDGQEFSLSFDPATKVAVVRIIETATREIVAQVPTEYILRVADYYAEQALRENDPQKLSF